MGKNGLGHIGAHALTGGVLAELQGGKFGHGFMSAGLTKGLTPSFADISGVTINNIDIGEVVMAATLGGTISELTGGKFANGAVTAAFAIILNAQRSRNAQKGKISCSQSGSVATCTGADGVTRTYRVRQSAVDRFAADAGAKSLSSYNTTTAKEAATAASVVIGVATLGAGDIPLLAAMALGTIPYAIFPSTENALGIVLPPLKLGTQFMDDGFFYGQKAITGTLENVENGLLIKGVHDLFTDE